MVLDGFGEDMVPLIKDWKTRCTASEGLPVPGNMVVDGLCQDLVDLIKDWIARFMLSGRVAKSRGLPHREV